MTSTTLAAVLVAVATVLMAIAKVLSGDVPNFVEVAQALIALATAFGLWKAADAKKG